MESPFSSVKKKRRKCCLKSTSGVQRAWANLTCTRSVHLIVSLMAHHTRWLWGARGNYSDFTGGVIFYNRMKFRFNPFSLSKVIESSSWFSYIHSTVTVCKMKNKTSFKRSVSYPWQCTCSQVCSCPRLLERGKGSSAHSSTLFTRLYPVSFTKENPFWSSLWIPKCTW